ncbi:uncharacterized protein LOC126654595 [Mercurialis annua]|uniref:uncharacterized protein LOC126654595 n=1 Tax=Mercurialis annua TaxID=3986 RepID=UPI00216102F6|nr:uncharacterized protein LOC126654595 [Mercurialis annua]
MAVSIHHNLNSEFEEFEENFSFKLQLNEEESFKNKTPPQDEDKEVEEEEEEFSFACMNPDRSPISADDVFVNGQIRPFFPLFNRDLLLSESDYATQAKNTTSSSRPPLEKLLVEECERHAEEAEGPYCTWKKPSSEVCKKSNSTGFSKLRRFRELVLRSNSDGKDAFVFFNHQNHNNNNQKAEKIEKSVVVEEKKPTTEKKKNKTTSAHEKLYVRNRAIKEDHKRKSYLPYRVGVFTYVNGLSRNVHPY